MAIPVVVAVKLDLAAGKVVASLNGNIPIGLSPGIVAYLAVVFEGAPLPKSVSRAQQCQSVSFDKVNCPGLVSDYFKGCD